MPFKVIARHQQEKWEFHASLAGLTLLEQLQTQQVPIKSSCMGKGICRQCRIRVLQGVAPITNADRKCFSSEQLTQGWRLSCCWRPRTTTEVAFPQMFVFQDHLHVNRDPLGTWWFACDMGTTGIEIAGVDREGIWAHIKALNKQVSMGPDVMTRLEFAQRNGVGPLYERVAKQLQGLTQKIKQAAPQNSRMQPSMWVAGNSAVTAFLAQQSIENLAVAPYQPASLDAQEIMLGDLQVRTLPLLYSFVGGDLFAGLFLLWQRGLISHEPWILMDVGTNSEILFWDGETLFVSSTPAGPAFEGSSISIGMRAEDGAILHPQLDGSKWKFQVIGDDIPKGLCGTGLIEMIDESVQNGIVSRDGEVLFPSKLALTSELSLSQEDVREFQLAKSAIQTGLELVQSQSSRRPQTLYLAGAFGENLPLEACQSLGLLPPLKTVALGNSSLLGTILWGKAEADEKSRFQDWFQKKKKPIELALSDSFQDAFVRNMILSDEKSKT